MHRVASSEQDSATVLLEQRPRIFATQNPARSSGLLVAILILFAALLPFHIATAAEQPVIKRWDMDGVAREALIYVPKPIGTNPLPVVFGFHGHGGSMRNAARAFQIHTHWPEAIVVYPQGLNTPGRLTDAAGKRAGWQKEMGDQNDRDLKFFDTMLASLESDYSVDTNRVYATGHSNGGAFTYLLWAARGEKFAAVAPSAALDTKALPKLKPKPVLHVAGENDQLVKFAWQERMIEAVLKLNQCGAGTPWSSETNCTLYPSKLGTPVVTYVHSGTHGYPTAAPAMIVSFFQQHCLMPTTTQ